MAGATRAAVAAGKSFVTRLNEVAAIRPLTVADYMRMAEQGIFDEDERVELLDGVIVEMSPINPLHANVVSRLQRAFVRLLPAGIDVRVRNPTWLSAQSLPQPDIAVVRDLGDVYDLRHPEPADVLLLVEVSDSTLRYDRDVKLPVYAAAGIGEVWIVDLRHRRLLVYMSPAGERYAKAVTHTPGDTVAPQALPDVRIEVASLFPRAAS